MAHSDRIMEILEGACALRRPERAAYLDAACGGDAAVRAEVESLLQSHDDAGRFLSEATVDVKPVVGSVAAHDLVRTAATIMSSTHEQYGQLIGRYKLLEVIGEGGFGTVWMAEQREPVKRRVALKIIKLGMDTRQVIARFEAERQALAMMDHPSIAKVLDAGSTETGRPYFVMEYIKGVPILEYCDTGRLSTGARLSLFAQVCQAIQHAHQKGVIHRDIKPGNVLITMHDGEPVPKVIDFGIAKATSAELTQKTLFTEHRQLIGTPAYMSPEQAEMSGLDIDTRSDIYSLGVLLYELLTGTTPFATADLMSEGFAEMMRIIREVEPPKPSTRLSTLGGAATRTATQRMAGDPRRLASILQGDLDWIVMKCLEKDRTRRYESASSLAADIRRYLSDEPVTAGAPTAAYRLQKFVKRNRVMVVAGGCVAGVLVLGIVGTSVGMVFALRERTRANDAAARATVAAEAEMQARIEAQANEHRAIEQAERAEEARAQEARSRARAETISEFVTTALRSGDAQNLGEVGGAGQDMTILEAMDQATRDIQAGRFKEDPETEAKLLTTIAEILRNNGRIDAAAPLVNRALELHRTLHTGDHPDLADSLEHVALVREQLGMLDEAEPFMVEALAMRRRLHEENDPALAGTLQALGMLRNQLGQLDEAESLCAEALELSRKLHDGDHTEVAICLNNLALVKKAKGDLHAAEQLFVEALAMHRRLYAGDHPEVAAGLNNLGIIRGMLGQAEEAESLFAEAVTMRERLFKGDHPATANSLTNLAAARQQLRRFEQAEPVAVRALEMSRRLFSGDHPSTATALASLASIREGLGRLADAEALLVESVEMHRRVYRAGSVETAVALSNLGVLRRELGRADEAEPLLVESLRMRENIFKGDHPIIVATLRNLAIIRRDLGRESDADGLMDRANEMAGRLGISMPEMFDDRSEQAVRYWSRREFVKSIPLFEALLKDQERALGPQHPRTRATAANLGVNYKDAGRVAEAIPLLEAAHRASKEQAELTFAVPHLLEAYANSADAASPATVKKALALVDEVAAAFRSEFPAGSPQRGGMLTQLTHWLVKLKAWDVAEPLAREALANRTASQPDVWSTFNSMSVLGGVLLAQGKLVEAEPLVRDGYRGLKQREALIPPEAAVRLSEARDRLIALADAKGDAAEAARLRAERDGAAPAKPQ